MANNIPELFNTDAEQAILGSILIDQDALLFVREIIKPDDFYIERHRWIYDIILDLDARDVPCDILTITDELERRGQLDKVGNMPYLTELMHVTPTSIHATHYAQMVKRTSVLRQLKDAAGKVARIAHSDEADPEEALQKASDAILQVSLGNMVNRPQPVKHYASKVYDEIQAMVDGSRDTGLRTGLNDLDRRLKGLKGGKLYLVAARPGMGKSSLALQMAMEAAKRKSATVLYFSLEMPGEELTGRIISGESGINGERLLNGDIRENEWEAFHAALRRTESLPIFIDDKTNTVEGIKARSVLQSAKGLDLVVIDYIQLVDAGGRHENRNSEVGSVSKALKNLARNLNIPVVAIASLNRQCESRHDKRPMLSDLRESGNLEYDADIVIFLYRDEIYNSETEYPGVAEVIIGKHRGGKLGAIPAFFKKETTQFADLAIKTESFA